MHIRSVLCLLSFSLAAFSQMPGGKVVRDKTNSCQLTVPATWTVVDGLGWAAHAPSNQGDVELIARPGKTVKPLSDMSQKALMVAKMISNTPEGVLYASQPNKGENPVTSYTAVAPGKNGTCTAMFGAHTGLTEDTIKKIAASITPVK